MQSDELTPLERHLAKCRPSADGLDTDAMLFEAGRAAAPGNVPRFVWPTVACGFAILSLVLAGGLVSERSERQALADRLRQPPLIAEMPEPTPAASPSSDLPASSYLAIRQKLEHDGDAWPARDDAALEEGPDIVPPNSVLRAWGAVLEP
jgi:hypothetical protein